MILLKNVTKTYGKTPVLDDVSLRIDPGEFVCVIGPSGAGKSTLLSLLVGAENVTSGSISVDDVDLRTVPPPALQLFRRKVGVVFQDYKLLQDRTVEENIAFPLEVCGVSDADIKMRVPQLLKRMNLSSRAKALPQELSGGEKARVAIARAIVHQPLILLADEPTGNLDPYQAGIVLEIFREIHAGGTTIVLATHEESLVNALQQRVIRLEAGKVTRDETGGYAQKPGSREAATAVKTEEAPDESDGETVPVKGKKAPRGNRKIRITSIHSDTD